MKNTIDLSRFKVIEKVGSGAFGDVYKIEEKESGEIYAAKISKNTIKEKSRDEKLNLKREVNTLSQLNHPSVLKFIGYSQKNFDGEKKPVIITEFLSQGSLADLIENSRDPESEDKINDTRKLIIIYGIASAMSYLHSHNILHRDLKPANILMDNSLYPIIADFGLAKIINNDDDLKNQTQQSINQVKGTPCYIAPEILEMDANDEKIIYSKECDVYSFAFIVYQLFSSKPPFNKMSPYSVFDSILKGKRPTINEKDIPEAYSNLIQECWSQDPAKRPTFDQIVDKLKTDKEFITKNVDSTKFNKYIDFIQSSSILYPAKEYNLLSEKCKKAVLKAETDPEYQFYVGKCLIEKIDGFPKNINVGTAYLTRSADNKYLKGLEYYCEMLIKGDIIDQDIQLARNYLKPCLNCNNEEKPMIFLLYGKAMIKKPNFSIAIKVLDLLIKLDNSKLNNEQIKIVGEGYYQYGKLLYEGKGIEPDREKALLYFEEAKTRGCNKSQAYLNKKEREEEDEEEDNNNFVDVVFLVDGTFSMKHFIKSIQFTLIDVANQYNINFSDYNFRYGAVVYRDSAVTKLIKDKRTDKIDCYDLTDNPEEIVDFFSNVETYGGGGDGPNDWASGFSYLLNRISWRKDSIRIVIHIADAPGHGKSFTAKKGFYRRTVNIPKFNNHNSLEINKKIYNQKIQNRLNNWCHAMVCQLAVKKIMFFCMNGSDRAMQCFYLTKQVYLKKGGLKYVILNQFNCSFSSKNEDDIDVDDLNNTMKELALNAVDIAVNFANSKEDYEPTEFEVNCDEQFEQNLQQYEDSVQKEQHDKGMDSDDSTTSVSSLNSNISRNSTREAIDFDSDFDDDSDSDKPLQSDSNEDEEDNIKASPNISYSRRERNSNNNGPGRYVRSNRRNFRNRGGRNNRGRYQSQGNRQNRSDYNDQDEDSDDESNQGNRNRGRNNSNRSRCNYNNRGRGGYSNSRGGYQTKYYHQNRDNSSDQDEDSEKETNQGNRNGGRNSATGSRGGYNNRGRGNYSNNRGGYAAQNNLRNREDSFGQDEDSDDDSNQGNRNRGRNNYNRSRGGYNNRGRGNYSNNRGGYAAQNNLRNREDSFGQDEDSDDDSNQGNRNRGRNNYNRSRGGYNNRGGNNQNRNNYRGGGGNNRGMRRVNRMKDDSDDDE